MSVKLYHPPILSHFIRLAKPTRLTRSICACLFALATPLSAQAEVVWAELLNDPDNIALNEQFVTERLSAGDLSGALSAIERVINTYPGDVGLRLLRAEVLVKLGNDALAEGELNALSMLPLSADQQGIVTALQKIIDDRARRGRTVITTSIGVAGSDNANRYPSSGLLDIQLNPARASTRGTQRYSSYGGAMKKTREVATSAHLSIAHTLQMADQDRNSVIVGLSQSKVKGRKYQYLTSSITSVFAGADLRVGGFYVRPTIRLNEIRYKTSANANVATANVTVGRSFTPQVSAYTAAEYSSVNQITSGKFATANQNDGEARSFSAGLSASVFPFVMIFAEGAYSTFNPKEDRFSAQTNAYSQSRGNANTNQSGTFGLAASLADKAKLTASVTAIDTKYEHIDFTSQLYRRDGQTRQSLNLLVKGRSISRKLENISFSLAGSLTRNDSNIRQFDYKRKDASLMMHYEFSP